MHSPALPPVPRSTLPAEIARLFRPRIPTVEEIKQTPYLTPVSATVIGGPHPKYWRAVEREHPSVEEAMAWVEKFAGTDQFVLAVLRDRRDGRVTKIEPVPRLRIFSFKDGDREEWWFATSMEAAKKGFIVAHTFNGKVDPELLWQASQARCLTDAELDEQTFREQDEEEMPIGEPVTFRARLEEEKDNLEARYFCEVDR